MVELSFKDAMDKFNNLPKSVQQAIIGTSSGWLTGYTLVKFGRTAGIGMGVTIFLLQVGQHYGYVNIDWNRFNNDLKKAKAEVEKQANSHMPEIKSKIQGAIKNNAITATSFMGGFFLGASTA